MFIMQATLQYPSVFRSVFNPNQQEGARVINTLRHGRQPLQAQRAGVRAWVGRIGSCWTDHIVETVQAVVKSAAKSNRMAQRALRTAALFGDGNATMVATPVTGGVG